MSQRTGRSRGRGETHEINCRHDALAEDERPSVALRVPHLADHTKEGWGAGVGKYDRGDRSDGAVERGRIDDANFLLVEPVARRRRSFRSVLNADGDRQGEDGGEDRDEADPAEDRDLAESWDRCEDEDEDGGDGDEDGGARSVGRDGVETDGDAQKTAASDHRHDCR